MPEIVPNLDQFQQLAASPEAGPVVMLNLLKFKPRAEGEEGSGAAAYARYGEQVVKMLERQGGKILWMGRGDQVLIGDPAEDWDTVVLVWYPSRKAFIEMVTRPEYEQIHQHREHGLARTVVVACTPLVDHLREAR